MIQKKEPCEYCKDSAIPGIHFPSDFSDREESSDGKVFIASCDTCGFYDSDVSAAEVIAAKTGWPILKSYDYIDDVDPKEREEKKGTPYYRPYFACTLAEAEALNRKES